MIAKVFRLWYHHRSRAAAHARGQLVGIAMWVYYAFWFYQSGGAVFCTVAVSFSFVYIRNLRRWVRHSEWMEKDNDRNPEKYPMTFGQLVPIFLILLIVSTFFQLIGDKCLDLIFGRTMRINSALETNSV
jgi:hypothetical protein